MVQADSPIPRILLFIIGALDALTSLGRMAQQEYQGSKVVIVQPLAGEAFPAGFIELPDKFQELAEVRNGQPQQP